MPNSTASYAAAEFAQHDFSHSLEEFRSKIMSLKTKGFFAA
jgi:hypothetical protein